MVNYRRFDFKPGIVYDHKDIPVFYVFVYSELVMESFVRYHFKYFDGLRNGGTISFHEERDREFLKRLVESNPGAQTLYGGKVPPGQIDKESL